MRAIQPRDRQPARKRSGIPDFQPIVMYADLNCADLRIVPVAKGVDDRLTDGLLRVFRNDIMLRLAFYYLPF